MSGAFSLHLGVILLLLMPPVAMQMLKQAREEPVVVVLHDEKPEEIKPEPPPPKPQPKQPQAHPRPTPVVQPTHVETVTTAVETPMSYPASEGNGPADIAPAREVAPTALAYGSARHVNYPMDALRRREHGTVILRVLVGADGNPQVVEIETSSGSPRLDKAARDAVLHWTFQAGTRNGVAQSAWAKVPIAFDLTTL
jgi:periplasmic protein TonB